MAAPCGARVQGLRVLVAEDDPDSRKLMVELLSGNGAEVTAGRLRDAR